MTRLLTIIILFSTVLIVTACAGSAGAPPTAITHPATVVKTTGFSTPVGPPDPSAPTQEITLESIALAYNPADGSLLRADSQGLSHWQQESGWIKIDVLGETTLSGVAINPTAPDNIYTALAMHSFRWDTLYAWIINDGIYRTEDGGISWKKMPDVPIQDPQVRGLTHSTLEGSMNTGWLYAATPSGAFLSMD